MQNVSFVMHHIHTEITAISVGVMTKESVSDSVWHISSVFIDVDKVRS